MNQSHIRPLKSARSHNDYEMAGNWQGSDDAYTLNTVRRSKSPYDVINITLPRVGERKAQQMPHRGLIQIIFILIILSGLAQHPESATQAQRRNRPDQPLIAEKPELVIQTGHSDIVRAVAFSPDKRLFASAGADQTIKLWDAESGSLIRTLEGHFDHITALAFSPDGKMLASGSLDKAVRVWNPYTGQLIRFLKDHDDAVNSVTFSPDGKTLAAGSRDETVNLWAAGSWDLISVIEPEAGNIRSVAFTTDGKALACACENKTIELRNISDGALIRTFAGHTAEVLSVAFTTNGETMISASADRTIILWNAATGERLRTMTGHAGNVVSLAVSADGTRLASGSQDKTIKIWNATDGKLVRTIEGHTNPVAAVAFSPEGDLIASASLRTVWLSDLQSGKPVRSLESHAYEVRQIAFSPDGKMVAVTSANNIRLWEADKGRLITILKGHTSQASSLAFSPDGNTLASGGWDGTIRLWNTRNGNLLRTIEGHDSEVQAVAFSPNGSTIASGGLDRTIRIWNVRTGAQIHKIDAHYSLVTFVTFAPDGKTLASASVDKTVKVWNPETGKAIHTLSGHTSQVHAIAFSPDGRTLASASSDKTLKMWETASGNLIWSKDAHDYDVLSLAFSADGTIIASGGFDKSIKLWDSRTGTLIRTLEGHMGPVVSLSFSPDQRTLASGSKDTTTKIWAVESGQLLASLLALNDREWIAFTPDGFYDGSDGSAQYLAWRLGNQVYNFEQFFERFYKPELLSQSLATKTAIAADSIGKGFAPPPDVKITSPHMNESFSSEEIELAVQATDIGGGIDEVRLYQNGKLVGSSQRGLKIVKSKDYLTTYRVLLTEGNNLFKAVAFSKDRTESKSFNLAVRLAAPEKTASLHMLVVGISRYKNPALNLNFGATDAEGLARYFQNQGSRLFRDVNVTRIYDENATKENILKAFQKLIAEAQPRDVVIIYFAGHGDSRGSDWYFIPYEVTQPEKDEALIAGGFSSSALSEQLVKLQSQKVLLLLDACRSGSAVTSFRGFEERRTLSQLARSTGIHIVAASTPNQLAAEVAELQHGVFTYVLLRGLSGEAVTGFSGRRITVRGLLAYVEAQLPEVSKKYRAEPQYPVSSSKGMDFPLTILP